MRPRGIPRGKVSAVAGADDEWAGFNEAAGNSPRKVPRLPTGTPSGTRFNEAAGNSPRKVRCAATPCRRGVWLQ